MKLNEVFPETKYRQVPQLRSHYKPDVTHPGAGRGKKTKHLGSGSYASTYAHEDKPHDVRRISKPQSSPDGSYWYFKELQEHPDRDNPYFPRYRSATKYYAKPQLSRPRDDRSVLSLSMERLQALHTLSKKDAESVFERWFGEHHEYIVWNKILQEHPPRAILTYNTREGTAYTVAHVLDRVIKYDWIDKYVVDSELKRAAEFVRKIKEKHARAYDFSPNNIMYRRSPQGIQIVLTDPLA